jgi:hypothetical protein
MRISPLKLFLMLSGFLFIWSGSAFALPELQLDIGGGTYDTGTETIVTASDQFTLYALLNHDVSNGAPTSSYFISAALLFKGGSVPNTPSNLGSFEFNGQEIAVTDDMLYGVPPVDAVYKDLPDHSIFPTYYKELGFTFSSDKTTYEYNSQDRAKGNLPLPTSGDEFFYQDFLVDVSGLAEGYSIHFDFYIPVYNTHSGKWEINNAPFSHDAQSGEEHTPQPPEGAVPEPATLILFGVGLICLAGFQRKLIKG